MIIGTVLNDHDSYCERWILSNLVCDRDNKFQRRLEISLAQDNEENQANQRYHLGVVKS